MKSMVSAAAIMEVHSSSVETSLIRRRSGTTGCSKTVVTGTSPSDMASSREA